MPARKPLPPIPDEFPCRLKSCGRSFRPTRDAWSKYCKGERPDGLFCSRECVNQWKREVAETNAPMALALRQTPEFKARVKANRERHRAKLDALKTGAVKAEKTVALGPAKPLNPPRICRGLPNWLGPKATCGALAAEGSMRCENCNREMARRRKAAEEG